MVYFDTQDTGPAYIQFTRKKDETLQFENRHGTGKTCDNSCDASDTICLGLGHERLGLFGRGLFGRKRQRQ